MRNSFSSASLLESLEQRRLLAAAPFDVAAPGVFSQDFRVTTFATGLNFPLGMQQLEDGSYLVPTSRPATSFEDSTGQLLRLVDEDADGTADAQKVLANNLPGPLTSVRQAGDLVFVTSPGQTQQGPSSITVLRKGKRPTDRYTQLGSLDFTFTKPWGHLTYALETRPTPGRLGRYDVFFNFGSREDGVTTPADVKVQVASSDGRFRGDLRADSIYKLTVRDTAKGPRYSDLTLVAYGLRNAAGIALHPETGDLYFQDNGIDGPNVDPQLSADEINVIRAAQIGNEPPDFGFAHDYINMLSGQRVGSGGVQPLVAFTRGAGIKAEGANDIAFAPTAFPQGLNNGIFVGFFGKFRGDGIANDQNPVVYYDLSSGRTVEFVSNNERAVAHPVGLLSTDDSLFVSDMAPTADFQSAGTGIIYQIRALPRDRRVAGKVFNDKDANGNFDRKDKGLARVRVFADGNGNGLLDSGEPSVLTKKNGAYVLSLPAGRFRIGVVPPSGYAADGDAQMVKVTQRRRVSGRDFALERR